MSFKTPRKTKTPPPAITAPAATPSPTAVSKIDQVLALMRREEGASIEEMAEVTGWLPHSTRAVLTGLRKKGHAITREKRGTVSCYFLTRP